MGQTFRTRPEHALDLTLTLSEGASKRSRPSHLLCAPTPEDALDLTLTLTLTLICCTPRPEHALDLALYSAEDLR